MGLVLASKSPRRRQLLALITPHFAVCDAEVDESGICGDTPAGTALALAVAKAQAASRGGAAKDWFLGCDTVVELDGETLGKPADAADAKAMLSALSGKAHRVHTGMALLRAGGETLHRHVETTQVFFAPVPAAEIDAVAATDEPYDKAGGYGIQGWAARYIPRIDGCYYNVMGLPVAALHRLLLEAGALP